MRKRVIGEGEIKSPAEVVDNISNIKNQYKDLAEEYERQFLYEDGDTGIRNEKSKSYIRLNKAGDIEMFSGGKSNGIYINNKGNSVTTYGEMINLVAPNIRIMTDTNGLIVNNHKVNSLLYDYSDKKNPNYWEENASGYKLGKGYLDDLKISCSVRWRCPGVPNMCGKIQEDGETHSSHWVRKNIYLTPFYWQGEDEEYKQMLKDIGVPL